MKLVYFGKKRPKVFKTVSPEQLESAKEEGRQKTDGITYVALSGKSLKYAFEPFKTIEVVEEVATIILSCAGDMFKCVDEGDNVKKPKPIIKTDGYVGDMHAERIKDLPKKVARENKAEEGKSVEQVIDEAKSKK